MVSSLQRIQPDTFPLLPGPIAANTDVVIRAVFERNKPNYRAYKLSVSGQYVLNGKASQFRIARTFRLTPGAGIRTIEADHRVYSDRKGAPFKALPQEPQTFQMEDDEKQPPLPAGTPRGKPD